MGNPPDSRGVRKAAVRLLMWRCFLLTLLGAGVLAAGALANLWVFGRRGAVETRTSVIFSHFWVWTILVANKKRGSFFGAKPLDRK